MDPEIASMLLLERDAPPGFVTRFQQTTPAIMAKGVEDTAFYRYCRLISLNDVGGDPSRFGIDVGWFHAGCVDRARAVPAQSADDPDPRRQALGRRPRADRRAVVDARRVGRRTSDAGSSSPTAGETRGAPDDVERYFLFQTLVGAWPIAADRIEAYMEKAIREAKRNTDWVQPNADWEEAVKRFVPRAVHRRGVPGRFRAVRAAGGGGRRACLARSARAQAHRARGPRHVRGRRARVPGARRSRQPPAGRLRLAPGDAPPADGRRGAGRRDPEAVRDAAAARAPRAAARAVRRLVRAARRRPLDVRVRARRRRARGRRGADGPVEGAVEAPRGRWRDVLRGEERSFGSRTPVQDIVGELGIAVFERP